MARPASLYTRKVYTDLSYLTCAQKLLAATDVIYPQFATHNAMTLSTIYTWANAAGVTDYEFQCLHGMGETLYDQVVGKDNLNKPCRVYAPVGSHQTLLAYLVRRLLENGANSSFVNQIVDEAVPIEQLLADPITVSRELGGKCIPVLRCRSQCSAKNVKTPKVWIYRTNKRWLKSPRILKRWLLSLSTPNHCC
jgi:RHH-type proline utilization regulon transcriptional repressor/proline dehydrogenase/delta 1-pyrroline-5-carboxylate dehydrogenase